jgi:hypothetical protein
LSTYENCPLELYLGFHLETELSLINKEMGILKMDMCIHGMCKKKIKKKRKERKDGDNKSTGNKSERAPLSSSPK